ncbi:hypothetical protein D3OALGB2SA_131 [Olavius algarvensis associated proteobacterium Delta 3]|nr:hypothetical protein D3OALGB2SA_131 [Olavius algarvensis associated proteobacterium Delta 3]
MISFTIFTILYGYLLRLSTKFRSRSQFNPIDPEESPRLQRRTSGRPVFRLGAAGVDPVDGW